jgi:integrase
MSKILLLNNIETEIDRSELYAVQSANIETLKRLGAVANEISRRTIFSSYREDKSLNTIRNHKRAIELFESFLNSLLVADRKKDEGILFTGLFYCPECWESITWGIVNLFKKWLLLSGFATGTIKGHLGVIRRYSKLAANGNFLSLEQAAAIQDISIPTKRKALEALDSKRDRTRVSSKKRNPTHITEGKMSKLKEQPDTPQGLRDRLLICIMANAGLRVGEVSQLSGGAIENGRLRFYREKTGTTQSLTLDSETSQTWQRYQAHLAGDGPLIRGSSKTGSLTTSGMKQAAINRRVQLLGARVGLKSLSPHDLRHYAVMQDVAKGRLPYELMAKYGWKSLTTPMSYIELSKEVAV